MQKMNKLNILVINVSAENENCKIIPHHYKQL